MFEAMLRIALASVVVLLSAGCQNPCQAICARMARYAQEDCGLVVPDGQIRACQQEQAGAGSRGDRAACAQMGDAKTLREEWSCNDLEDYFETTGDAVIDTGS